MKSLELVVFPERLEGAAKFFDNMWRFNLAELYGPLNSVFKRWTRHVSRTHIGCTKAVEPLEEPRFCVKAAATSIQRNLEIHIRQFDHFFEGLKITCADICRRKDPNEFA